MTSSSDKSPFVAAEWAAIAAIIFVWGVNNAAAKIATDVLPPFFVGGVRFAFLRGLQRCDRGIYPAEGKLGLCFAQKRCRRIRCRRVRAQRNPERFCRSLCVDQGIGVIDECGEIGGSGRCSLRKYSEAFLGFAGLGKRMAEAGEDFKIVRRSSRRPVSRSDRAR